MRAKGWVAYAGGLLVGLLAMLLVLPPATLVGAGPGWFPPQPDQAQALTGHLAFQADAWRWPLLDTARLFWPHGISLALVDSNALVSLLAKVWTHATGSPPVNWLGAFIGACWLLQPIAAVYAARGLRVGLPAALAAAVLAVAWPALMFRMGHLNLCAHFLLLLALGSTFRALGRAATTTWSVWIAPAALLLVAVLTHPYLFQLCAAVLAAVPLQAALRRRPGWRLDAAGYLASGVIAVGVLMALSGPIGGGDKGFAFFSMNLVSPVWPQMSGVFGAGLPIIDGTGGQYEGFNWLGAGTMLLLLAALVAAIGRRAWPRPALALVLVLAGLTLLSLGSRVYAGPVKLLDLGTKPWEDIFGSFRTSGRAFWPVGYALMLGGVAAVDRLRGRVALPLLTAAVLLQAVDIVPLLTNARSGWTNGSGIAVPPVPLGTTLFTAVPHPGCTPEMSTKWRAPLMLLDAVRGGAQTGDIGLGRSPKWFSCEQVLADALELPLLPGETRAIFGGLTQVLRPALLGPEAVCRRQGDIVQCARGVQPFDGEALPPGTLPPPAALPLVLGPGRLDAVLGKYWRQASDGMAWSEGPHSTLLIPVQPGRPLILRLQATGVAFVPGEARTVSVAAGRTALGVFSLPDGIATEITVAIPAGTVASGMLRLALDVVRPVDPARRGLLGPVQRAAIKLGGIDLRAAE